MDNELMQSLLVKFEESIEQNNKLLELIGENSSKLTLTSQSVKDFNNIFDSKVFGKMLDEIKSVTLKNRDMLVDLDNSFNELNSTNKLIQEKLAMIDNNHKELTNTNKNILEKYNQIESKIGGINSKLYDLGRENHMLKNQMDNKIVPKLKDMDTFIKEMNSSEDYSYDMTDLGDIDEVFFPSQTLEDDDVPF